MSRLRIVDALGNLLGAFIPRHCSGLDCDIDRDAGLDCHECGHSLDCEMCCTVDGYFEIASTLRWLVYFGVATSAHVVAVAWTLQHLGAADEVASTLGKVVVVSAYVLLAARVARSARVKRLVLLLGVLIAVVGILLDVAALQSPV